MNRIHNPNYTRQERVHVCLICDSTFRTKQHLVNHVTGIHEKAPLQCKYCSARLKGRKSLNYHLKTFHKSNDRFHKCDVCQKTFLHWSSHFHPRKQKHVASQIKIEKLKFLCDYSFNLTPDYLKMELSQLWSFWYQSWHLSPDLTFKFQPVSFFPPRGTLWFLSLTLFEVTWSVRLTL